MLDIIDQMLDDMLEDEAKSYACPECGIVTKCYTDCPLQMKGN